MRTRIMMIRLLTMRVSTILSLKLITMFKHHLFLLIPARSTTPHHPPLLVTSVTPHNLDALQPPVPGCNAHIIEMPP
jgi:hypothetical protein